MIFRQFWRWLLIGVFDIWTLLVGEKVDYFYFWCDGAGGGAGEEEGKRFSNCLMFILTFMNPQFM